MMGKYLALATAVLVAGGPAWAESKIVGNGFYILRGESNKCSVVSGSLIVSDPTKKAKIVGNGHPTEGKAQAAMVNETNCK
jgi:hypothetical protein